MGQPSISTDPPRPGPQAFRDLGLERGAWGSHDFGVCKPLAGKSSQGSNGQ